MNGKNAFVGTILLVVLAILLGRYVHPYIAYGIFVIAVVIGISVALRGRSSNAGTPAAAATPARRRPTPQWVSFTLNLIGLAFAGGVVLMALAYAGYAISVNETVLKRRTCGFHPCPTAEQNKKTTDNDNSTTISDDPVVDEDVPCGVEPDKGITSRHTVWKGSLKPGKVRESDRTYDTNTWFKATPVGKVQIRFTYAKGSKKASGWFTPSKKNNGYFYNKRRGKLEFRLNPKKTKKKSRVHILLHQA